MAETQRRYVQPFARNKKEFMRKVGGKQVRMIRFRAIAKYKVDNPDFIERPEGEDTRTSGQKRRTLYRQVGKNLECKAGTGQNAEDKTLINIAKALDAWIEDMEAEEAKRAEEASRQAERPTEGEGVSVYELVTRYIDARANQSRLYLASNPDARSGDRMPGGLTYMQPSTERDYRHTARRLEDGFSEMPAKEVTRKYIKDWERAQTCSTLVVKKCHILLNLALNDAADDGVIPANPMGGMRCPTVHTKEPDTLGQGASQDVLRRLGDLTPTPVVTGAIIALACGLRVGECCGLRWGDIDWKAGTYGAIHVERAVAIAKGGAFLKQPKSRSSSRVVYIPHKRVADALVARRNQVLEDSGVVRLDLDDAFVLGDATGRFANPTTISKQWTALADSWGLTSEQGKRVNFHLLRHANATAAKIVTQRPTYLDDLRAKQMGHSTAATTDKFYAGETGEGNDEMARCLAEVVGDYLFATDKPKGIVAQLRPTGTTD